eukprot:symbB.v1.2.000243.t1/scaffold4.1/size633627/25
MFRYESMGFQPYGWTPVPELELEALLTRGQSCRWRWRKQGAESLEDAEAKASMLELTVELSKRISYQVFLGLILSSMLGWLMSQ